MIHILLADDHNLFRESMVVTLQQFLPNSNILQVASWFETQCAVQTHSFDIALLDLAMPGEHHWQQELHDCLLHYPQLPICVISAVIYHTSVRTAFNMGVKAYIPKTASIQEMQQAIKQVLAGNTYLPQDAWFDAKQNEKQLLKQSQLRISLRQQEILNFVAEGYSNQQIADKLNLTEGTVKRHISNTFKALQAKNRTEAVQIARRHNLIQS